MEITQLQRCALGKGNIKRCKKWSNWLKETKIKTVYLNITGNTHKLAYIRSQASLDLLTFWERELRARLDGMPKYQVLGTAAQEVHAFIKIMEETKRVLLEINNRDRAVIDLLRITQGNRTVMDFLGKVEGQVQLTRADRKRITKDDLNRMALIAGFWDTCLF